MSKPCIHFLIIFKIEVLNSELVMTVFKEQPLALLKSYQTPQGDKHKNEQEQQYVNLFY